MKTTKQSAPSEKSIKQKGYIAAYKTKLAEDHAASKLLQDLMIGWGARNV